MNLSTLKDLLSEINKRRDRVSGILYHGSIDPSSTRFGYFGEFGYGLIAYLPYLNYLSKELHIPLKTIAPKGMAYLFDFSTNHLSIEINSTDGWGERKAAIIAKKSLSDRKEKLFAPIGGANFFGRNRYIDLGFSGSEWKFTKIHQLNLNPENYLPLKPNVDFPEEFVTFVEAQGQFLLLNFKDYFNWGLPGVQNFFTASDIRKIVNYATKRNLKILLNRFPAPIENNGTNYFDAFSYLEPYISSNQIIDLAPRYALLPDLDSRGIEQARFMKMATEIIAVQGGNSIISIILGDNVTILMRGGMDYPDCYSLGKIYKKQVRIVYELDYLPDFD